MRNYWGRFLGNQIKCFCCRKFIVVKGFRVTDIGLSTKGFDWIASSFRGCLSARDVVRCPAGLNLFSSGSLAECFLSTFRGALNL